MPVTNQTSIQTYQGLDGSNTTMFMHSETCALSERLAFTGGFGVSTNFRGKNAGVIEGKLQYNMNDHFGVQMRLRNSLASKGSYSQLRLAPGYKTDVSKNVSVYVNPYTAVEYKYKLDEFSARLGGYAGATYKHSSGFSFTGELENPNILKSGIKHCSINAIIGYNF